MATQCKIGEVYRVSINLKVIFLQFQVIYDLDDLLAKEEEEESSKETKKEVIKA